MTSTRDACAWQLTAVPLQRNFITSDAMLKVRLNSLNNLVRASGGHIKILHDYHFRFYRRKEEISKRELFVTFLCFLIYIR